MGQIHGDDMTLEIPCIALHDFRLKSVGMVSKMCFAKICLMEAQEESHVRNQAGGCDLPSKECVCNVCHRQGLWFLR